MSAEISGWGIRGTYPKTWSTRTGPKDFLPCSARIALTCTQRYEQMLKGSVIKPIASYLFRLDGDEFSETFFQSLLLRGGRCETR